MNIFLQGLTMGLAYVAPIGMQNLFIINTALTQKRSRIYLTALIVIFFDVTLALACFFGVGAIMEQSPWLEMAVLLIGSIIVIYMGIGILRTQSSLDASTDVNVNILKVITTACVVTWFNPQALIDGSMMLGAFKATLSADEGSRFILGVAFGSTLWFLGISTLIPIIRDRFNDRVLRVINIVCGSVIIVYGIKLAYHFLQMSVAMINNAG
ncbi:MAG TPA: L-lysine permease [Desulfosporosinus sp.]|nr:L-lysine permease [Desulfosporosinus sp.]